MHFLLETSYASFKRFELQRRPSDPTVSRIFIASSITERGIPAVPPSARSSLRAPLQSETSQRSHRQPDLHRELHYRDISAVPPSARSSPRAPLQRHLSGPNVSQIFTASSITETSQRSHRQLANREKRTHDTVTKTIKKSERNKEASNKEREKDRKRAKKKEASAEQKKIII
jgi:hypothetical protein